MFYITLQIDISPTHPRYCADRLINPPALSPTKNKPPASVIDSYSALKAALRNLDGTGSITPQRAYSSNANAVCTFIPNLYPYFGTCIQPQRASTTVVGPSQT